MYNYVQLDSNNIVFCVSQHSDEIVPLPANLVALDTYDPSLKGQQYNAATGTFAPVPITLEQEQQLKLEQLQVAFEASFTTFQSAALSTSTTTVTKTYPIDSTAQGNFKDLQQRLIADPNKNTFYFKTIEDGTLVAHTRAQFLQLLDDAEAFEVNKIQQFDKYEAQINAATDIATLRAMTFTFS